MPTVRTTSLSKLLGGSEVPVYVLDASQVISYVNPALETWTGCEKKSLIGLRSRYHTSVSRLRADIIAAALAPPPEVLRGARMNGILSVDLIRSESRRRAEFVPIPLGNGSFAVVVFVEPHELDENLELETVQNRERKETGELHELLGQLHSYESGILRLESFSGKCPEIKRALRAAKFAVDTNVPVLIRGESGCGKNHLASAIHYGKKDAPGGALIPLDCEVFPPDLIGATVLAFRERYDRESSNHRHTLLFTTPEQLSRELENILGDLLYNLPENQRIISVTTNGSDEWPCGEVLRNLFCPLIIDLPPLRKRKDEIPLLTQGFIEELNSRSEKQIAGLDSEALDAVCTYDWPGNIDELRKFLEEAFGKAQDVLVRKSDLPKRLLYIEDARTHPERSPEPIDLEAFLYEIEEELVRRAVKVCKGNKSKAAKLLGISRAKLHRKLGEDQKEPEV